VKGFECPTPEYYSLPNLWTARSENWQTNIIILCLVKVSVVENVKKHQIWMIYLHSIQIIFHNVLSEYCIRHSVLLNAFSIRALDLFCDFFKWSRFVSKIEQDFLHKNKSILNIFIIKHFWSIQRIFSIYWYNDLHRKMMNLKLKTLWSIDIKTLSNQYEKTHCISHAWKVNSYRPTITW